VAFVLDQVTFVLALRATVLGSAVMVTVGCGTELHVTPTLLMLAPAIVPLPFLIVHVSPAGCCATVTA
jgi:hypothetical protein